MGFFKNLKELFTGDTSDIHKSLEEHNRELEREFKEIDDETSRKIQENDDILQSEIKKLEESLMPDILTFKYNALLLTKGIELIEEAKNETDEDNR